MAHENFAVLCPVYNDWVSFARLAQAIDLLCPMIDGRVSLFAVDDGSTVGNEALSDVAPRLPHLASLQIIRLATNLGHQRAIAIGLSDLAAKGVFDAVIVMDADGEDKPEDMLRLIALHQERRREIIVAKRAKRSEGFGFRLFYLLYKTLFLTMTGHPIAHGNFCLIPSKSLQYLTHMPALWNNFAASILRSRLPVRHIDTSRGKRYDGSSKMNLLTLFIHGLSAISVYVDIVIVRVFITTALMVAACIVALIAILTVKFATALAIPGWATSASGIVAIIIFQNLIMMGGALLILLNNRNAPSFIPAFDSTRFVRGREELKASTDAFVVVHAVQ